MIIFIMSIAKRQKQIIGKEEYIVFQWTDFSLDQYYNFISQSYAVIVYYQLKSALSLVQQSGSWDSFQNSSRFPDEQTQFQPLQSPVDFP